MFVEEGQPVEQFADQLGRLSELSDEELAQLEQDITDAFDSADANGEVDTMQELADAIDQVRSEMSRRAGTGEQAPAAAPAAQAATPAVKADGEPAEEETPAAETAEAPAAEAEAPPAKAEAPEPAQEPVVEEEQPAPAAETGEAAAEAVEDPAEVEAISGEVASEEATVAGETRVTREDVPEGHEPVAVAASPSYVIRAGGDIPGITSGSELEGMDDIVDAMTKKVNSMRGVGGDGEYIVVASMRNEEDIPDERILRPGDLEGNSRKVRELIGDPGKLTQEALVATGWCAPRAPIYDVPTIGTTGRPIRDSLPTFSAARGGITWMTPPGLSTANAAISRWEYDTPSQSWKPYAGPVGTTAPVAGSGGVPSGYVTGTKPCIDIPCGTEATADLIALPVCLCFDNLVSRAFPEWIRANTDLTMVVQARFAEQYFLARMFTLAPIGATVSGGVVGDSDISLGAVRDTLVTVRLTASQFRWRNRLAPDAPMQWLAPAWLRDAMISDLQMQAPGDNTLGTGWAEINGYLTACNISPIWYIDDLPVVAAGGGGAQPQPAIDVNTHFDSYNGYGTTAEWLLYPTGSFVRLDGGSLDLGIVRTKDDLVRNKYCEFAETFEALAYFGPAGQDGWVVRGKTPVLIAGGAAALVSTAAGMVVE